MKLSDLKGKGVVKKIIEKYLLGVYVIRSGGSLLYSFKIDESINNDLICQFVAALSMFGEENVGKISSIMIKGLDVEMKIVAKHDLILVILFHAGMVQDYLEDEAEKGLDRFYKKFKTHLEKDKLNQALYERFDKDLWKIIQQYLVRIGVLREVIGVSTDLDFVIG